MYSIQKNTDTGVELLPDITDTPIWGDYNPEINNTNKTTRVIAKLYMAIQQRENYYQKFSPTAYGDPQYTRYVGEVIGILTATEWEEEMTEELIIIKKNKRKILVIDRVKRTQSYYNDIREISKLKRELGL